MEKVTFDQLPQAVSQLFTQLQRIESLIKEGTTPPHQEADEILTVEQCAEFLNLSKPTIYGLISKGNIPVMKRSKRCYFLKAELIKYLQEGKRKSHAEIDQEATTYLTQKTK